MRLDANPLYRALTENAAQASNERITDYFDAEENRIDAFSVQAPHVFLDFSKNLISNDTLDKLVKLAESANIPSLLKALFKGEPLNTTENRPALHTALRALRYPQLRADDPNCLQQVTDAHQQMKALAQALHQGTMLGSTGKKITQLVSIGIGGSYLGPKMLVEALRPFHVKGLRTYFVSNIDGGEIAQVLEQLDPEQCLFVVQSKSFTTLETLKNSQFAIDWLKNELGANCQLEKHLLAVTSATEKATAFGVAKENILPMWDWVGGRYSLWSAIGFPIVFQIGFENFMALLAGAEDMDKHVLEAPIEQNLPVLLALIGIWNQNFLGHDSIAVIPYDESLRFLPEYLQQLDMESNGKSVSRDGEQLDYLTGPALFGGSGTNGQHAYHQLFHQGTSVVPLDFIAAIRSHYTVNDHHQHLLANCLAQSRALMQGKSNDEAYRELLESGMDENSAKSLAPHKVIAGNKPTNTMLVDNFNPASLGALIAAYEHKVFIQGVIWGINSFDQWGVELGKILEREIFPMLANDASGNALNSALDPSTRNLISMIRKPSNP